MKYERYVFREHSYRHLNSLNKLGFGFNGPSIKIFANGYLFCYYNILTEELRYEAPYWIWK
jgi:hypothetical protein